MGSVRGVLVFFPASASTKIDKTKPNSGPIMTKFHSARSGPPNSACFCDAMPVLPSPKEKKQALPCKNRQSLNTENECSRRIYR